MIALTFRCWGCVGAVGVGVVHTTGVIGDTGVTDGPVGIAIDGGRYSKWTAVVTRHWAVRHT